MTTSDTKPRTVDSTVKGFILAALILPLGAASAPAVANGIQMLPPVTEATKTQASPIPCPPGGTPNILTWDGTNPISCAAGITVTGGYVGIGMTVPIYPLDVASSGDAVIRAITADRTGNYVSAFQLANSSTGNVAAIGVLGNEPKLRFMVASNAGSQAANFLNLTRMTIDNNGNVGIGTTSPHSSLDLSVKTDAISMPKGTTGEEPESAVEGMTRYNTDTHKLEYWNGTVWVPLATSNPQITTATAPWPSGIPYNATGRALYLDCPSGTIAVGCTSVESPSGRWVCDTTITTDPYTGNSACEQDSCGQGLSTDPGYYTSVSCIKF